VRYRCRFLFRYFIDRQNIDFFRFLIAYILNRGCHRAYTNPPRERPISSLHCHGPLQTRPECWNLRSTSKGWPRDTHCVFKWEWARSLKNCKKIRNGRTELNFFTSRYNPRLNVKKISASYVHFWFFYNFSKIEAEIFFTFRQRLYLDVKKNFSSVHPFLIFYNFSKIAFIPI